MKITKRFYTEIVQQREYEVKYNGIGMEWTPRIEKVYEFCTVDEFIRIFTPYKLSEDLKSAILKAYNECGNVTFNCGNGNKTFSFTYKK